MAFDTEIATLMQSFSDLNTLATGGVWYRNLPTDENGEVDWTKNYIAWDFNKAANATGMNNTSLFCTYNLLVVANSADINDQFDSIISSIFNNLHNYRSGNILSCRFEGENKYTKLEEGMNGLYVSESLFSIIYAE